MPATGRGFGIPLDRQNSVFAGSAASTVGPPHRCPIVFDKSAKRRANTPAAPEASRGVHPGRKPKTVRHKKTQKQGSVLTFGVLSKICRSRERLPFSNRQGRLILNAEGGVLFCQAATLPCDSCIDRRALGPVADHAGRCCTAAKLGKLKENLKMPPSPIWSCPSEIIGLTVMGQPGGRLDRRQP